MFTNNTEVLNMSSNKSPSKLIIKSASFSDLMAGQPLNSQRTLQENASPRRFISGFDLVPRIRKPTPKRKFSPEGNQLYPQCASCRGYQQKYLESEQQRIDLQTEVNRVSKKIDDVRILQEAAILRPTHQRKSQFSII